jgi:hypothetical protein
MYLKCYIKSLKNTCLPSIRSKWALKPYLALTGCEPLGSFAGKAKVFKRHSQVY